MTRALLLILAQRGARLAVLSRSHLITCDVDLLKQLNHCSVTMSITMDSDDVRKQFEPQCASIDRRFDALQLLTKADIHTRINVAPRLPLCDASAFAERILASGVSRVHINTFHEMDHSPRGRASRRWRSPGQWVGRNADGNGLRMNCEAI